MNRPAFLKKHHDSGATIVAEFRKLPKEEASEVDRWLLWASAYGSLTWQETCLCNWINEHDDLDASFEVEGR